MELTTISVVAGIAITVTAITVARVAVVSVAERGGTLQVLIFGGCFQVIGRSRSNASLAGFDWLPGHWLLWCWDGGYEGEQGNDCE